MFRSVLLNFIALSLFFNFIEAHHYTRCELAKALLANGFPRNQLENWVCLVEAESSGDTNVRGGPNDDGSYDNGLFQINSRYWCQDGYPGHDCHISCENLRNDDISDDSKCAQLIYNQSGFGAWVGWRNKCQENLPDIHGECGI